MTPRSAIRALLSVAMPGPQRLVLQAYLRAMPPDADVASEEVSLGMSRLRHLTGGLATPSIRAARQELVDMGLLCHVAQEAAQAPVMRLDLSPLGLGGAG